MSAERRDREALDLVGQRTFASCAVVELGLEMLARRMNLGLYGRVRGDAGTYRAALTFFGVEALSLDNAGGAFPQSAGIAALDVAYSDDDDAGSATLTGNAGWSMRWKFDGLAYEEQPALLASLADDF